MFASFAQNRCFTAKGLFRMLCPSIVANGSSQNTRWPLMLQHFRACLCLSSCLVQCSPLFGQNVTVFASANITVLDNSPTPTRSSLLVVSRKHAFLEPCVFLCFARCGIPSLSEPWVERGTFFTLSPLESLRG